MPDQYRESTEEQPLVIQAPPPAVESTVVKSEIPAPKIPAVQNQPASKPGKFLKKKIIIIAAAAAGLILVVIVVVLIISGSSKNQPSEISPSGSANSGTPPATLPIDSDITVSPSASPSATPISGDTSDQIKIEDLILDKNNSLLKQKGYNFTELKELDKKENVVKAYEIDFERFQALEGDNYQVDSVSQFIYEFDTKDNAIKEFDRQKLLVFPKLYAHVKNYNLPDNSITATSSLAAYLVFQKNNFLVLFQNAMGNDSQLLAELAKEVNKKIK